LKKKLKIGIIGAGFVGGAHIEAIRRTFLAEIAGIAEVNNDTAKEKALRYMVPSHFSDYNSIINDPDIDVIHICTPNNLHFEISKKAIKAEKHVICEKPLTLTTEQGKELYELAKKKNVVAAIDFNIRYYPLIRDLKEKIENNGIGSINVISGHYFQDWLLYDTDYSWRLDPAISGELRAVSDIGSHWLDLLEYISGLRIEAVYADLATFHSVRKKPKHDIETFSSKMTKTDDYEEISIKSEDYATILLRFKGGAHGVVTLNQMAAGRKNRLSFEINGSMASVSWNSENPNIIEFGYRNKPNEILIRDPSLIGEKAKKIITYPGGHNEGFPDTLKQFFTEVYQYIIDEPSDEHPSFPTFYDGYRQVLLSEYIKKSSIDNRWCEVPS
jgi:predicted dehydrogenase